MLKAYEPQSVSATAGMDLDWSFWVFCVAVAILLLDWIVRLRIKLS